MTAAGVVHWRRGATVALHLEEELGAGDARLLAERELVFAERIEGRPIASARLSSHSRDGFHRPDLAVLIDAGVITVEVELSAKALRRLEAIVRAWRRAGHVAEVRYYCPPGTVRRRREGTRTRERDFIVGPDEFKRLGVGEAIVIDPKAPRRAEIVRVWAADRGGEG